MNVQRIMDKLSQAIDDMESDLAVANSEKEELEFQLGECAMKVEKLEDELRCLCKLLHDSHIRIPLQGHFVDINPFVSPDDPLRGKYELTEDIM